MANRLGFIKIPGHLAEQIKSEGKNLRDMIKYAGMSYHRTDVDQCDFALRITGTHDLFDDISGSPLVVPEYEWEYKDDEFIISGAYAEYTPSTCKIEGANAIDIDDVPDGVAPFSVTEVKGDMVHQPSHYNHHPSGLECIQITAHLVGSLSNVYKYVWRVGKKFKHDEDREKAKTYIQFEIDRVKFTKPEDVITCDNPVMVLTRMAHVIEHEPDPIKREIFQNLMVYTATHMPDFLTKAKKGIDKFIF